MNNQNSSNGPYSNSSSYPLSRTQSNSPTNQNNSNQSISNSTTNNNYGLQSYSSNREYRDSDYNSSNSYYYQTRYNSVKGVRKNKDISVLDGASYFFTFFSFMALLLWCLYSPFNVVEALNSKLWSLTFLACLIEFGCFIIFIYTSFSESLDLKNGHHWIVLFLFLVSFFMSSNLMIRVINTFDFRSDPIITTEFVKNRKETGYVTRNKRGEEREHRTYYLILGDEDKTSGEKMITVSRDVYDSAEHGDHWVTKYKPGFLGIKRYSSYPYIVHNHLMDKYWNEKMQLLRNKVNQEKKQIRIH